ncbi:hypothetical protein KSP40_PGU006097 [Platanthera guangdongensis]|uniref:Uncharacterized protein n=1 Tax=Platanthera guangdongensis TaxID=2320717 RepID=A0ABR2N595_9ASPA
MKKPEAARRRGAGRGRAGERRSQPCTENIPKHRNRRRRQWEEQHHRNLPRRSTKTTAQGTESTHGWEWCADSANWNNI